MSEPREFPRKPALVSCGQLAMHPRNIRTTLTDDDALFAMLGAALKADVRDKAKAVTPLNEEFDYTWPEIAARVQLPLAPILARRQGRPRPRAVKSGTTRRGNAGARAPRIKPSVVHEMCARVDRRELTADQVVGQLRALLGDWHPTLATTVHHEKTTNPPETATGATSTEAQA